MKNIKNIRRAIVALVLTVVVIIVNPMQTVAGTLFQNGLTDGGIVNVGTVAVGHMDYKTGRSVLTFRANLYTCTEEGWSTYHQSISDATNALIYEGTALDPYWANCIGDHVNSKYSGKTVDGKKAFGTYQLWNLNENAFVQVKFIMPNGDYVVKTWLLDFIDTNAYQKDGQLYFSDGTNMDTYGLADDNKNETIMMDHCWPYSWGSYVNGKTDKRVIAVFRENHSVWKDVYVYTNGSYIVGDYDLYTGAFNPQRNTK